MRSIQVGDGRFHKKRPTYIRRRDGRPFAFAGLWEHWEGPEGIANDSCVLLTIEPNDLIRRFHHRMPVILDHKEYDLWLGPRVEEPERLLPLLRPFSSEALTAYPVNPLVNNPRDDTPECVEPLAVPAIQTALFPSGCERIIAEVTL